MGEGRRAAASINEMMEKEIAAVTRNGKMKAELLN
jgi:hypothetical protein